MSACHSTAVSVSLPGSCADRGGRPESDTTRGWSEGMVLIDAACWEPARKNLFVGHERLEQRR